MSERQISLRERNGVWHFRGEVEGCVIRRRFTVKQALAAYLHGFLDPEHEHEDEARELIADILSLGVSA